VIGLFIRHRQQAQVAIGQLAPEEGGEDPFIYFPSAT
jgi:hypothetical protein